MRALLSFTAALALAATSFGQSWMLKAPYEAKTKHSWNVTVLANIGGQEHEAKMKQHLTIDSKSDKEIKAKGSWSDITLDGQEQGQEDASWDITFNPNGSISSAGDGADYARMVAPAAFVYPEKEVKAGDKWTTKFKPAKDAKEMTVDYEVVEITKVGDKEAMKIKGKLSEDGPMKADVIYWVAKDGRVLKYELDLKNWTVPFAGMSELDAKIKGELIPAKS